MSTTLWPLLLATVCVEARVAGARAVQEQTRRLAEFGIDENPPAPDTRDVAAVLPPSPKGPPPAVPKSMPDSGSHVLVDLLAYLTVAFVLKAGAIASSVLMTFSPLRAVWSMQEAQSTLSYPPFTFFCGFACGLQWCIYGTFAFLVTQNYGFLILVYSNAFGVLMGVYYVRTYFVQCKSEHHRVQLHACVCAAAFVYLCEAVAIPMLEHSRALLIVGTVSACMSIMVSVAPIADLPHILLEKDVSGMPSDVVRTGFFCSLLWLGCALLLHDTWILIPNLCGLVLGAFQLLLLHLYSDPVPVKYCPKALKARDWAIEEWGERARLASLDGTGGTE